MGDDYYIDYGKELLGEDYIKYGKALYLNKNKSIKLKNNLIKNNLVKKFKNKKFKNSYITTLKNKKIYQSDLKDKKIYQKVCNKKRINNYFDGRDYINTYNEYHKASNITILSGLCSLYYVESRDKRLRKFLNNILKCFYFFKAFLNFFNEQKLDNKLYQFRMIK